MASLYDQVKKILTPPAKKTATAPTLLAAPKPMVPVQPKPIDFSKVTLTAPSPAKPTSAFTPQPAPQVKAPTPARAPTAPIQPSAATITRTSKSGKTTTAPAIPVTPTQPGTPAVASVSAPGTPATPRTTEISREAEKALSLAQKAYENSLKISPEELSTQEDLDKLIEQTTKAYNTIENQPIGLGFITGQLASTEKRALALAEPLEQKLARLQAARQSSLEASKFALDRADKTAESELTRAETARTEEESARRFGITTGLTETSQAQAKLEADRQFEEDKRQFGLNYALQQRETAAAELKARQDAEGGGGSDAYQAERQRRAIEAIDDLLPRVTMLTAGTGSLASFFPNTSARDFAADLNMLKSSIITAELKAMRDSSKTGGALGQVSNTELEILSSSLGSLDQGQSPENLRKNLQRIKDSINRYETAVAQYGGGGGGGAGGFSGTTSSGMGYTVIP